MRVEVIRLIKAFINDSQLSDYIYKPLNRKLSLINTFDLLSVPKMNAILESKNLSDLMMKMKIETMPTKWEVSRFLATDTGKKVIKTLVEDVDIPYDPNTGQLLINVDDLLSILELGPVDINGRVIPEITNTRKETAEEYAQRYDRNLRANSEYGK